MRCGLAERATNLPLAHLPALQTVLPKITSAGHSKQYTCLGRRSWSGWSLAGLQDPPAISMLPANPEQMASRLQRWCTSASWATWPAVLPISGDLQQDEGCG